MKSLSQRIEIYTNQKIREKVRKIAQPGVALEVIGQEVNAIIAQALDIQLEAERDEFLGRQPYERLENSPKRNGFKSTSVPGFFGRLFLHKPALRQGSLHSPLLTALKQAGKGLASFLAIRFWLKGAATRSTAAEINAALGTKLSHSTVSTLTNALEPAIRQWMNRPIPPNITYLLLDAAYLPVRRPGFTSKQALLLALGMDSFGNRHVLGFLLGDRESLDSWQAFINDLLKRGLNRNTLRLVISDEHKAIEQAVKNLLAVPHQLCLVHKIRNLRAIMPRRDWGAFLNDFKAIYWADSRKLALQAFGRLQARWMKLYPRATAMALDRFDNLTTFMNEPQHVWRTLRSSNLIERFIAEIKRRTRAAGTMHSELEVAKIVWSVSTTQEDNWSKRKLWKSQGGDLFQEGLQNVA